MNSSILRFFKLLIFSILLLFKSIYSIISFFVVRKFTQKTQSGGVQQELLIFVYSIIPWDGVWQRPQHFAVRAAEKHKVIYVDPIGLQHLLTVNGAEFRMKHRRINKNLDVVNPVVIPGGKTKPLVTLLNDFIVLNEIQHIRHQSNSASMVLVTNSPLADRIAGLLDWDTIAYDIIDDYISTSWAPSNAAECEKRLLNLSKTVFTGTYSLFEKKRQYHSQTEFIPCGVEVDHFRKAAEEDLPVPADLSGIPKPIFGYFGGLNERLDADILINVAKTFENGSVVLIGPVFNDFGLSDFADRWASVLPSPDSPGFRLKPIPSNLRILGIRSYQELPAYVRQFDVCLLPYVMNQVTCDIHPVKILEYLAAGKPVVSTALPDVVRFYSSYVEIASNADEYIEKIRKCLGSPEYNSKMKIEFAASKTWESMTNRMLEKIRESLKNPYPLN